MFYEHVVKSGIEGSIRTGPLWDLTVAQWQQVISFIIYPGVIGKVRLCPKMEAFEEGGPFSLWNYIHD